MDSTADGDSYKTAARAYIKALFSKIRALEPELKESLGRKEEAYLRRIDDGKVLAD